MTKTYTAPPRLKKAGEDQLHNYRTIKKIFQLGDKITYKYYNKKEFTLRTKHRYEDQPNRYLLKFHHDTPTKKYVLVVLAETQGNKTRYHVHNITTKGL